MNYLAHAFLSRGYSNLLAGNYLADFVGKSESEELPNQLYSGVLLHRLIDSYTDDHSEVRACTKILHPTVHKYAPVIVDVYFDYLLQKHWDLFGDQPVEHFRRHTYDLLVYEADVPPQYQDRMHRMIADDWLGRNASYEGLASTFNYIQRRAKFSPDFSGLVDVLQANEEEFSRYFCLFFPDLIQEVDQWIDSLNDQNEQSEKT